MSKARDLYSFYTTLTPKWSHPFPGLYHLYVDDAQVSISSPKALCQTKNDLLDNSTYTSDNYLKPNMNKWNSCFSQHLEF